jgi:hypothetical protein
VKILKIAKKLVVWVIKHRIFTGFRTIGTFQKSLQKHYPQKREGNTGMQFSYFYL